MKTIILEKENFYADCFWSLQNGSKVPEDIFVKEYLNHYFTLKDLLHLHRLVGEKKVVAYAKEVGNYERVSHLFDVLRKGALLQ